MTAKDAIRMATINGAKTLGLDKEIGSIEMGKQADLILVDISSNLGTIKSMPNHNLISDLVYNKSGLDVDTTIVAGEILMQNKQIPHLDVNQVIAKVQKNLLEKD